jgi:SOS-response transcriptional repressor LexA
MKTNDSIRLQNLSLLIREAGGTSAFARKIGRSQSQVSQWLNSSPDSKTGKPRSFNDASARLIEVATGKPVGWIDQPLVENTEAGPDVRGRVPLISWVQAGAWAEIIDNFAPGDAAEWLPCPISHGPRTYVLRVRGESMLNPAGRPSFQDGDLIFVDPDRQAEQGSLVVVRLEDEHEATFKKLVIEGDQKYLRALNPAWPQPIMRVNGNATICGVVISKLERF